ncbi:MAG: LysM peptidoglycan-binding domain-containing protein [Burkholderiales bacterium]|nr:LysM peptidoglycan-binding domain-containing protein [Burkholderiales bacterium]
MHEKARKYIINFTFALALGAAAGALAQAPKPPLVLKPNAPERYVVQPGDTLWSIAERFTDSPWRWSELWNLNREQIRNPHRIHPGDVIVLDRSREQPALALETVQLSPQVRAESTAPQAVPPIPQAAIEPFLSRPLVVEPDGLDQAPVIVATETGRVVIEAGARAYVKGIGDAKAEQWFVYRRGQPLVDPDENRTLGFEAIFLGTARIVRAGEPALVELTSVRQEVAVGDRLIAAGRPEAVNYVPRAPGSPVNARVISIYGGVGRTGEAGRLSIVALSAGKNQGLEAGHVLALYRPGGKLARAGAAETMPVVLPEERYGLVFVFRVFDRVSYALVMNVARPVNPFDLVRNP